jgi:hypothetical protein
MSDAQVSFIMSVVTSWIEDHWEFRGRIEPDVAGPQITMQDDRFWWRIDVCQKERNGSDDPIL